MSGVSMDDGRPPRSRNQRLPAACDAPTATAAPSLVSPLVISRQNDRSTPRRSAGAPGDFIGDLPVNSIIHPAGLPISTSALEVLRRPVESCQYTSYEYTERLVRAGIAPSRGRTGTALDNAMAESIISTLKRELISRYRWPTRLDLELALVTYIGWYNSRRRHRSLKTRRDGRTTRQAPLQVLKSYNEQVPKCLASK
jgi:hypothetical protein